MMKINNISKTKSVWIVFTREPEPGRTKTRLMPYFSEEQCAELHKCFLKDLAHEAGKVNADIIISFTGGEPVFLREAFGRSARYIEQRGTDLGKKMENAVSDAFDLGYERVVLTGTDIPELKANTIRSALEMLDTCDVVLGPTTDGGYYLIGMDQLYHQAFDVNLFGVSTVYEETSEAIRLSGLKVGETDKHSDVDEPEDVAELRNRIRENGVLRNSHTKRFLNDNMRISVIIPVFNESSTIDSMIGQLMPYRDDAEIIFVDGGSTDTTVNMIGDRFTVIKSEKGRGRQMNVGALAAGGDVLFFLHCDSILPKGFLSEIRRCMSRKAAGCFGVRFDSKNLFMITNRILSNCRALFRGLVFGDQGLFIDRELFLKSGMFSEIPVMEDYDFSLRMRRKGYRPAMTRNRILTSSRRYGKNTASVLLTEFRMWKLRRLFLKGVDTEVLRKRYSDIR